MEQRFKNYIMINGRATEITDDMIDNILHVFEKDSEKNRNPFSRVNGNYYTVKDDGVIWGYVDVQDQDDNSRYDNLNYFNDKAFAKQVALHQLLYRKLLKFAYNYNCLDTASWNGIVQHWFIGYDCKSKQYVADYSCSIIKSNTVYFNSRNAANWAINQVVRRFEEEHPEFSWK